MLKSILLCSSFAAALAAGSAAQVLALKSPSKSNAGMRVLDDAAVRALAMTFEDSLRRMATEECAALFDEAALLERASKGIPATEKVRRNFQDGAQAAWNSDSGLVASTVAMIATGGSVRWLRASERDGERTAIFRLTRADASAPEYIELVLAPHGDRAAIIVDYESSTDAVLYSRVLRRWLLALVADAGRSLPSRIAGQDREFAQAGTTFENIDQAFEAGRNADALAKWATLPQSLREDPSVVLSRLRAALAAGLPTFDATLEELRASGLANRSVDLLVIDVAMATNHGEQALKTLALLTREANYDPYLDALRGSILRDLGRRDAAREACRRALAAEPNLEDAYWTLLGIAIETGQHEDALAVLNALNERFVVDWTGLENSPAYAAFLESKPGSRWRSKLASSR